MADELLIYCDESDKRGTFFSDFYGGLLVQSNVFDECKNALETCKQSQNLFKEVKWSKVTENYLQKYICLMNSLFDLVESGKVKLRIMFTQNAIVPVGLTEQQRNSSYHMLYYQFVKHAFGLRYCDLGVPANLRIFLDKMPANREQNRLFKSHLMGLNLSTDFRNAKLSVSAVSEIDSASSVLMQSIDIVLGAMQFRLNDKHKLKLSGSAKRGSRTIAKEKLYRHVLERIRLIRPNFNVGISTGTDDNLANRWHHPYRHWKFIPRDHIVDDSLHK